MIFFSFVKNLLKLVESLPVLTIEQETEKAELEPVKKGPAQQHSS